MMHGDPTAYLVADIGGTNGRFGVVRYERSADDIEHVMNYSNDDYLSVLDMIRAYQAHVPFVAVDAACISVAAPVDNDKVSLTNRSWSFSIAEMRTRLGLRHLEVANDFISLAHCLPYLSQSSLVTLCRGRALKGFPKLIVGPGTGLGAAAVTTDSSGGDIVIGTEAGHMSFAPGTLLELEILRLLKASKQHVALEDIVSGSGLPQLYRSIAQIRGCKAEDLTASQIARRAATGSDETSRETLSVFCSMLGTAAGDLALCFQARGGVYLGGGIVPKLVGLLLDSEFEARFRNKGIMSPLVADIPVQIILDERSALTGASCLFRRRRSRHMKLPNFGS